MNRGKPTKSSQAERVIAMYDEILQEQDDLKKKKIAWRKLAQGVLKERDLLQFDTVLRRD